MNIFITGSSGYLGRHILKNIDRKYYKKIVCLINSEKRYKENDFLYENCIVYKGCLSNYNLIETIFKENNIDYVIHAGAMKYIDTCEKFQKNCIETNITGTYNICHLAKKYNIKNVLTISTDKANKPGCLYGISKLASERITISHGFSVYQGVNFWWSDGSFLPKWYNAIKNNGPIILYNKNHIRYFSEINDTAKEILNFVKIENNRINYPNKCWKIKIIDVFNYLKELFPDKNYLIKKAEENNFDKCIEEINGETKIIDINKKELIKLLKGFNSLK